MASYRLYLLDGSNRIVAREDFDADDDSAAVAFATDQFPHSLFELWELGRLVARCAVPEMA